MQIRWGKPPRIRQLADSGCELSRDAVRRLQWMQHYLQHGRNAAFTCRHFGISRRASNRNQKLLAKFAATHNPSGTTTRSRNHPVEVAVGSRN
jgi:hypothetical protein